MWAWLCSGAAKCGDRTPLTCSGSLTMTALWCTGSAAAKNETNLPRPHYSCSLALRILRNFFAVSGSDCMDMSSVPRPVSNLSQSKALPSTRWRGRPKNEVKCVKIGVCNCGLFGIELYDGDTWGATVWQRFALLTSLNGPRISSLSQTDMGRLMLNGYSMLNCMGWKYIAVCCDGSSDNYKPI